MTHALFACAGPKAARKITGLVGGDFEQGICRARHPFRVDLQVTYRLEPRIALQPGDTLTTTFRFDNPSEQGVGFGQSTRQELCDQVAVSYPADALANNMIRLLEALNTC